MRVNDIKAVAPGTDSRDGWMGRGMGVSAAAASDEGKQQSDDVASSKR